MTQLIIQSDSNKTCATCMSFNSMQSRCDSVDTTITRCFKHNSCRFHIDSAIYDKYFGKGKKSLLQWIEDNPTWSFFILHAPYDYKKFDYQLDIKFKAFTQAYHEWIEYLFK